MQERQGGCACGAIRYRARGEPTRVGICHCNHCRLETGSVFSAFAVYPAEQFDFVGETRDFHNRHFCPVCGSRLFEYAKGRLRSRSSSAPSTRRQLTCLLSMNFGRDAENTGSFRLAAQPSTRKIGQRPDQVEAHPQPADSVVATRRSVGQAGGTPPTQDGRRPDDLPRPVAQLFLLIGQTVKLTQNPTPRTLLAFRLAGYRRSDPLSSAEIDNGEWHGQSSNRSSTWFTIRLATQPKYLLNVGRYPAGSRGWACTSTDAFRPWLSRTRTYRQGGGSAARTGSASSMSTGQPTGSTPGR